jgi:DNA-binding transcriptional MerR regulator
MESDDPVVLNLGLSAAKGEIEEIKAEIAEHQGTRRGRFAEKFFLAAIGSIPWIGGYLSTLASLRDDEASIQVSELQTEWLEEHHEKLAELEGTLTEVDTRFASLGETIRDRIESEEYLGIVQKAFRVWDAADTKEKRKYISNIVTNAGGTRVCSDDIVRLFVEWIERYHESHFAVVREIYQNPGSTRHDVWGALYNVEVRDDSPEADLFKLLFRDLTTGGIIRQGRDVNQLGQFVTKRPTRVPKGYGARTMKSAFDDKEAYMLTALGEWFIHYTMNEAVGRLSPGDPANEPSPQ